MPVRTYRNPTFATTNAYRYGFTDDQLVPFVAAIECTISLNRKGTEQNFSRRSSQQKW
ncbi:MAG: hypothetical protein H6567_04530 [Lewinellaceae bacterium]|nr:hypothetical protein [Lewinellaceae bacterium]